MSELAIKRNKIAKQIGRADKLNYFKYRRMELISQLHNSDPNEDYQPYQTHWLKNLIHRSLVQNELLEDLRRNSLLPTLQSILKTTIRGRDIQLILVLLGNILIDDVTLDQKEAITQLCLHCYTLKPFRQYLLDQHSGNISCMLSIAHNLTSIVKVISYVDENLGVRCQQVIMNEVIQILQLFITNGSPVKWEEKDSISKTKNQILDKTMYILKKFLYAQQEYLMQIPLRFARNLSNFIQLLKFHASMVFNVALVYQKQLLHKFFLQIEYWLSQQIEMLNFPMYFQSKSFISIVLNQIYLNRDEELNRMALGIFYNLLNKYQSSNILIILSVIEADVHMKDKLSFFQKLLYRDSLRSIRLKIIRLFMSNPDAYRLFQAFFQHFWKDVLDSCSQFLRGATQFCSEEGQVLNILIISSQIQFQGYSFTRYLRSIGGQSLLEYICTNCEQQIRYSQGKQQNEQVIDKAYFVLDILKRDE